MSPFLVKICGLNDARGLDAALKAGADMVGHVFFEPSPRHVSLECAAALAARSGDRAKRVALTVDADDETLDAIVAAARPDILQLHGAETPSRVEAVKRRFGLEVMRALPVGSTADRAVIRAFDAVADLLLLDAPPPKSADRPGGNGETFDWSMLDDLKTHVPWLVAGGLHAGNVAAAIAATRASGVDVSSGVESAPGVKDPERIASFVAAARS